ncbi:MAG: preprotein translocase subunit SecG [Sphingomonas sp.]
MTLFLFLIIVHAIIAFLLVVVILAQRSEGGGLGMGGSPSGLMSARGTADFLTRATSGLAVLFVSFSILLAVMAATRHSATVDASLARKQPAAGDVVSGGTPAAGGEGSAAAAAAAAVGGNVVLPQQNAAPTGGAGVDNSAVPLDR